MNTQRLRNIPAARRLAVRAAVSGLLFVTVTGALAQDTAGSAADSMPTLSTALTQGDVTLSFNYRFEYVEQDGFAEDAKASTLRSRLNYQTGTWQGFSAVLEFDDISEIGPDDYNGGGGTTPLRTHFPVVADPADTHVNQVYLDYQAAETLHLRGGRQRIKLDNDRFIGNVGWRQNEQTYDAVRLDGTVGDITLFYAYVFNVNRIFGNDVAAGDHDHDTHLFRAHWVFQPQHQLNAYYYAIDNHDDTTAANNTYGLRYQGRFPIHAETTLQLTAEYAHQTDSGDNPVDYSANYWRGEAAVELHPLITLTAGVENLDGNRQPGRAFRTPLATLHAFNGWADLFLTTPDNGLRDHFAGLHGHYQRLSWQLYWHDFQAEQGTADYGSEWDAAVKVNVYKNTSLLLKAAFFDSDNPAFPNTTKIWSEVSISF